MPGSEFDVDADAVILAVGQLASAPETAAASPRVTACAGRR
jgi:NADPH-dependent glutamate synthase beta subunit-like oxidoreductase